MNPGEHRRMYEAEERHWWYAGLHELVLAVIARLAPFGSGPLRILDAGCGTGRLMQLMREAHEVDGFDLSPEAVAFCRKRGLTNVAVADLGSAVLPAGRFDVITAIDVLYHRAVHDESAVLRSLGGALKPGGVLIRNDPAFELLRGPHDVAVHSRVRYRTPQVRRLIEAAGLTPEIVTYRLAALAPLIAVHRLARKAFARVAEGEAASDVRVPSAIVNRLLLAAVRRENRRLLRGGRVPFGTSVFAVARRPAP